MKRVLLIEDDEVERYLLHRVISKFDPEIEINDFSYADDALAHLRTADRDDPSLILVDINMPRMDGFQFADAFGALAPEQKGAAKVWMVSNSIDPRDRERALAHPELDGFIDKGASAEAFGEVLSIVSGDCAGQ